MFTEDITECVSIKSPQNGHLDTFLHAFVCLSAQNQKYSFNMCALQHLCKWYQI